MNPIYINTGKFILHFSFWKSLRFHFFVFLLKSYVAVH